MLSIQMDDSQTGEVFLSSIDVCQIRERETKTYASDFLLAIAAVLDLDVSAICAAAAVDDEDGEDD